MSHDEDDSSSIPSQAEQAIFSQDTVPSSPPMICSEGEKSTKTKKPPPVTPRSFKRFFTPRTSSNTPASVWTSRKALQEITSPALNRYGPALARRAEKAKDKKFEDIRIYEDPPEDLQTTSGKKRKLSPPFTTSTPQSSSLRNVRITFQDPLGERNIKPDDSASRENKLKGKGKSTSKDSRDATAPNAQIRHSKILESSGGLLLRSHSTRPSRGRAGRFDRATSVTQDRSTMRSETASFFSRAEDVHSCSSNSGSYLTLPFCVASCNSKLDASSRGNCTGLAETSQQIPLPPLGTKKGRFDCLIRRELIKTGFRKHFLPYGHTPMPSWIWISPRMINF